MTQAQVFSIDRHRIGIDGHGVTTLIGLSCCPLNCSYCINPRCHQSGSMMSLDELLDIVKIDNLYYLATGGGITFGGGEPLLQYEFIKSFAELCDTRWRITIETCLNVSQNNILPLLDVVDEWIIDIKDMDSICYKQYTGCSNAHVLQNLHLISENNLQSKCVIRVPLIPQYNTKYDVESSAIVLKKLGFETFDFFTYIKK